jgi:hypothetical protein
MYLIDSQVEVDSCDITSNVATTDGGGVYIQSLSKPSLFANSIPQGKKKKKEEEEKKQGLNEKKRREAKKEEGRSDV